MVEMGRIPIVKVADRPDTVPVVSRWLWEEWGRANGRTLEETSVRVAARTSVSGPEQCFVLLVDEVPVATASFVHRDLPSRPDLTPWLAGVFVQPEFRCRGFASHLVRAVEVSGRAVRILTIWLFTGSAVDLYARLG
jgi:hypothetical protein